MEELVTIVLPGGACLPYPVPEEYHQALRRLKPTEQVKFGNSRIIPSDLTGALRTAAAHVRGEHEAAAVSTCPLCGAEWPALTEGVIALARAPSPPAPPPAKKVRGEGRSGRRR